MIVPFIASYSHAFEIVLWDHY